MTRLIVLLGFIISFAAGLSVANFRHRPAAPSQGAEAPGRGPRGSWLVEQLGLSKEQQQQMDAIWSDTARRGSRDHGSQRAELRKQRDAAIAALMSEQQKPAYDAALQKYQESLDALEAEWKKQFAESVEKTRAILTPQQREKYDAIQLNEPRRGPGTRPGGPRE